MTSRDIMCCAGCRFYSPRNCYCRAALRPIEEVDTCPYGDYQDRSLAYIVLNPGAYKPERAHETDAGYDLRTPAEVLIPARGSASIDTGVHISLPSGTYGKLESKSGLNVKHGIVCLGGVIDEGYTGPIIVKLYNLGDEDYVFAPGDKVVQLIIQPYLAPETEVVSALLETDRGDAGFGSTGR